MKAVIIGNSGSGKTRLASQMSDSSNTHVVHLDEMFWEPGGFDKKRDPNNVSKLIAASKAGESWVVEGVFGELAERYLDEAEILVWLDIEWSVCKRRLLQRGSESKAHMNREQSDAGLIKLIEWAADYSIRGGGCSFDGHLKLFDQFRGERHRLISDESVNMFIKTHISSHH